MIIRSDFTAALHSFALSRVITDPPTGLEILDTAGTPSYRAPEVLEGSTLSTDMSDVYAFGGLILAVSSATKAGFYGI